MDLSKYMADPVSLSMRMRSEASVPKRSTHSTLPSIAGGGSVTSSVDGTLQASKMMQAMMMTASGKGGKSSSSPIKPKANHALSMSKEHREEMIREMARQELEMERIASNIDAVDSGGVFADRTVMTQPSASCVRCGTHASVCMSCTEHLAEDALNFYRKTRARGAASLFANAITQTGVTKVVKYIMFVTWRNGFRERKWKGRKQAYKADLMHRNHYLKMTFYGWVKFNMSTVKESRDKRIEELEKRVTTLESITQQASNLKDAAERQAKTLKAQFDELSSTIETQETQINSLESQLVQERSRVVGLSTLSASVVKLEDLYSGVLEARANDLKASLHRSAQTHQPFFDYGKTYQKEEVEMLFENETKRREKGKKIDYDDLDPSNFEMVELLLQWASAKSRDANAIMEPGTGKVLKWLPKYRAIETFSDLKNGVGLLRLVLALVYDIPKANTDAGKYEKLDGGGTKEEKQGDGDDDVSNTTINYDFILQTVKESTNSGVSMIECALVLARKYLGLPTYHAADVVSCRNEICCTLLGHLMLGSAAPAQQSQQLNKVAKLIDRFEKANSNLAIAKMGVSGFARARKIERSLGVLLGTVSDAVPTATAAAAAAAVAAPALEREDGGDESGICTNDGEEAAPAPAAAAAPAVCAGDEHKTKYAQLTATIDAYLNSLGEWDENSYTWSGIIKGSGVGGGELKEGEGSGDAMATATTTTKTTSSISGNQPFVAELEDFERSMVDMHELKAELAAFSSTCDASGRLAIDVRRHLASFLNEVVLQELKWHL